MTVAPAALVASAVMFAGAAITGGVVSTTLRVKLVVLEAPSPSLSVAVMVTVRLPIGPGSVAVDQLHVPLEFSLIAPMRRLRPGLSAFKRLDLPTPDGPANTDARPRSRSRNAGKPSGCFTEVASTW